MGQQTQHTIYRCPCGDGRVRLTSTLFGGGGKRRVHTELVSCPVCKGEYHYAFADAPDGTSSAVAEHKRGGEKHALTEINEAHPPGS